MNHLRLKHWLVLGIAAAVLLAGGIAAVLLVGKNPPDTPPSETVGTEIETEVTSPANPYTPTITIADDTLSPGQMWDISFTFGDEERQQHFEMHGVAFLKYTGEPDVIYVVNLKNSMVSSQLPSLCVPYAAPVGTYDLYVGMENMTTEGCHDLGCDSFETLCIENFLTVLPPAYEEFTVTATLSPNVLEPGASLDGILSVDVRRNTPTISLYPSTDRHSLNWKAEMRQVDGDYSFEVWDTNVAYAFFIDSTLLHKSTVPDEGFYTQLRPNAIPADAPEGFYDLVVTMEEYGYEWVIPKLLLVWPEGKSLFEGMPVYDDFTCTAEITDDSVIHGDTPEIRIGLTCKGEEYRDFEASLVMSEYDVTIPLTYDGETQSYAFPVELDIPSLTYTLVVRDTHYDYTWYFPGFVTVEYWVKTQTITEENGLSLRVAIRDDTLSRWEEWDILVDLRNPDGIITPSSVRLRSADVSGPVYEMRVLEPGNESLITHRVDEGAPVGRYDLVVEMIPAAWWPEELDYEYHMWVIEDFLTVIDERDTLS